MWSETNTQGKITIIRIILKTPLFRNFYSPSPCQFRRTFHSGPSTAEWLRRTCLWRLFRWPNPSLSWCAHGATTYQPGSDFALRHRNKSAWPISCTYCRTGCGSSLQFCYLEFFLCRNFVLSFFVTGIFVEK